MDILEFLLEKAGKQIERSNDPIKKINDYLLYLAQIIFILFVIFNQVPMPCSIDLRSNNIYKIIAAFSEYISSLISLRELFLYGIIVFAIVYSIDYIYDSTSEPSKIFIGLLPLCWTINDSFRLFYNLGLIFHGLNLLLTQFYGSIDNYSSVVTIYTLLSILELFIFVYNNNQKQLDDVQNNIFREQNWSGYYDIDNTRICLYDVLLLNQEEYRVYKTIDDSSDCWCIYNISPNNNSRSITFPLQLVKNRVKLIQIYKKYENGKIMNVPSIENIEVDLISLITSLNTYKSLLEYIRAIGKKTIIESIWIISDEEPSDKVKSKVLQEINSFTQAQHTFVAFDKKQWEKYFKNNPDSIIYSDLAVNIPNITVNYINSEKSVEQIKVPRIWEPGVKRVIDIIVSLLSIMVLFPVWGFVALLIKLDDPGPIMLYQQRIGMNGKIIRILKFRTLELPMEGHKPRVTSIGKFLLKYGLDKTPIFYNVFTGDMSLVGHYPYTLNEYSDIKEYKVELTMKPGLTGPFIFCKKTDTLKSRIELDQDYIKNWNLLKDFKILWKSFVRIFTK